MAVALKCKFDAEMHCVILDESPWPLAAQKEMQKQARSEQRIALKEMRKQAQIQERMKRKEEEGYQYDISKKEIQEWSSELMRMLTKYIGMTAQKLPMPSSQAAREFKKGLKSLVLLSALDQEMHLPTECNQKVWQQLNVAGTQANCQCGKADFESLKDLVQTFLYESKAAGLKRVCFTTGVGNRIERDRHCRELLPQLLQENDLVSSFEHAPKCYAVYVDLRSALPLGDM